MTKKLQAFTLPEVLLSIVLLGIIGGMSLPLYRTFIQRNELDQTTTLLAQTFRHAQFKSVAGDGDSKWGVKITSSDILLFKGESYAARDQSFDETISIPPTITFSGLSEVVFEKGKGVPSTVGTSTFISTNGETRTVSINQKGMVSY